MKKLFLWLLVLAMLLSFSSCSSGGKEGENPWVGKWVLNSILMDGEELTEDMLKDSSDGELPTLTLAADGKMVMTFPDDDPTEGKWTADGNKLKLTSGDEKYDAELKDGKISLTWQDDYVWIMAKDSSANNETKNDPETKGETEAETKTEGGAPPQRDGERVETKLISLVKLEGWEKDEESFSDDSTKSNITVILGKDTSESIVVKTSAEIGPKKIYLNYLSAMGLDPIKVIQHGEGERVTLGGREFVKGQQSFFGELSDVYVSMDEAQGGVAKIVVTASNNAEKAKDLLDNVRFTFPEAQKPVEPWPWDGAAFQGENVEFQLGDLKLQSKWVAVNEPILAEGSGDKRARSHDGKVYVVNQKSLVQMSLSGDKLKVEKAKEFDTDYEYVTFDQAGNLFLSQGVFKIQRLENMEVKEETELSGYLQLAPDGNWGLSYWSNSPVKKVTNVDGKLAEEDLLLGSPEDASKALFEFVHTVFIDEERVFVSGWSGDKSNVAHLIEYDKSMNPVKSLKAKEDMGYVCAIAMNDRGIFGVDSNFKLLHYWDLDGNHQGSMEYGDIFKGNSMSLQDLSVMEDGNLLVMVRVERDDRSAEELAFYIIQGF